MRYHITYRSRIDNQVHTDRVFIQARETAEQCRRAAIREACWKHPDAKRLTVRAVRVGG